MPLVNTPPTKRTKPKLILASSIDPRETQWLWYPYIPAGTVTALFGQGGMGKSFITCDIASRLSRGAPLPGQEGQPTTPQKVLMLSAEDDYHEVLIPRLIKLGANLDNIAIPGEQFTLDAQGAKWLAEDMQSFSATVVFIDPIVYYAGGKMDMNKANEVRAMMETLKSAASAAHCSVIVVGHIRKSIEGGDANMMMGSADWVNAARSGLWATKTNDGTRVLKHVKTNYGKNGDTIEYEITDQGFEWGGVYDEGGNYGGKPASQKEQAVKFLQELLADGPEPANSVFSQAEERGISVATLNRAKVGVAESVYSRERGKMWRLLPPEEV